MLDAAILLGVVFFIVLGYRDGFRKKIYGIAGFWIGLIAATELMYIVGHKFSDIFSLTKESSHIFAFCVIFLIIIVLENLYWRWFGSVSGDVKTMVQRFGGAAIGMVQGLIAVSLLLVMFAIVRLPHDKTRDNSYLYVPVLHLAPTAFDMSTSFFRNDKGFLDVLRDNFKGINLP